MTHRDAFRRFSGGLLLLSLAITGCDWIGSNPPLYKTLDTPPAPALTAVEALESFQLAPGFRIELVAAEPLVEDPVAMAWDAAGRLFVVEMRGFMPDAHGSGEDKAVGRVVLLEDRDGDGRMDTSSTFLEGLVLPRAVAVVNEGLLVGEPPNLWLCPDIAGKTRCEDRRRLGEFGADLANSNVEHLENGLMMGLDNWLYNANSNRRLRLVDGALEVQTTLPRGQWGMDKDDAGRLYYNTNSNFLSGDYFPANALSDIDAGIGKGLMEPITHDDQVFSVRVNPGVNRAYLEGVLRKDGRLHKPTSVSGLAVYRGHQFPPALHGDIFVPEPAANVVVQLRPDKDAFAVTAEHITYPDEEWGRREFLASTDERFRPVDAKVGPDGALYIIDMYRGIIQHKAFLTEQLREQILERGLDKPLGHGRIWRIRSSQQPPTPGVNVAAASDAERVALLGHANGWVRDTAQRLLLDSREAHEPLAAWITAKANTAEARRGAVHALWTLAGRGALSANLVEHALQREPEIALQALRAGGNLLRKEQLLALEERSTTLPLALRQQLLFTLEAHNRDPRVQAWLLSLHDGASHPALSVAALQAARGIEGEILARVLETRSQPNAANNTLLAGLAAGYYRELRKRDADPSPLLATIAAQTGAKTWRELAMLEGLAKAANAAGFSPWALPEAPALFRDPAVGADDPRWDARLAARRAFTWPGDELAAGLTPLTPRQQSLMAKGETFYGRCAACHGEQGGGIAGLAPELAGSDWVTGPVEWLAFIILDGLSGPITVNGTEWDAVMPGHRQLAALDSSTLEGLLIYLRRSWGNQADAPTASQMDSILSAKPPRQPWTVTKLEQVPVETGLERYTGKYKISFVTLTVSVKGDQLAVNVPMYGASTLEPVDQSTFAIRAQPSTKVRFETDNSGAVQHLVLLRDGSESIATRVKSRRE